MDMSSSRKTLRAAAMVLFWGVLAVAQIRGEIMSRPSDSQRYLRPWRKYGGSLLSASEKIRISALAELAPRLRWVQT